MTKYIDQQAIYKKLIKYISRLEPIDIIIIVKQSYIEIGFELKDSFITIKKEFNKNQAFYKIYIDHEPQNILLNGFNLEDLYDAIYEKSDFNNTLNNFYKNINSLDL